VEAPEAPDYLVDTLAATRNWEDLPESVVCCQAFYEKVAHYLIFTYVIESGDHKGQPRSSDPAVNYLRILINLAADLYKIAGTQTVCSAPLSCSRSPAALCSGRLIAARTSSEG